MTAPTVSLRAPFSGITYHDPGILRPQSRITHTGSVGNVDLRFQWDTDSAFGGSTNEVVSLEYENATSGTYILDFDGVLSNTINWDDNAAAIKAAIEAAANVHEVNVTGTGTVADPYLVEYQDPINSARNVPDMTVDTDSLVGDTLTLAIDTQGVTGPPIDVVVLDDSTASYEQAPTSDLGLTGQPWFWRVAVIDRDDGLGSWSAAQTLNYVDPITYNRYLYLHNNVGVAFHDKDEPAGGWGTGGTEGADGDNTEDFHRYLYLQANVGVGFGKDEPTPGWGPNSPATDAPDGLNLSFNRYLYLQANLTDTQPCPFLFSMSRSVVETGDSLTVSGQGLVSADDPTDAWDAEVRLYASADFGASFVTLATVTWDAGEILDTITATVPGGATSGFIAVVHTTTPTCDGSNFLGLTVIALPPDSQAGWWVEVWDLRNTTPILRPVVDAAEATIESIPNDIGRGTLSLPANHPDLLDIVDRTADPPTQGVVKVYQHGRFSYAFLPEDYTSSWDDDGARLVRLYGEGQEGMLKWGRALWKDFPAQPAITRTWLYGSTANAADWGDFEPDSVLGNGGFEDANHDPWYAQGTASVTAQTTEVRTGAYAGRVITSALNDGINVDVSVQEGQQAFFDIWVKNAAGGSKTFVLQVVDAEDNVQATDTVVVSTAVWQPLSTSWVPDTGQTVTMRVIQTVGAVGTFWVDDGAAFTDVGQTFDATRATYQLTRDHTTGGLHSMEVSADAGGDTTFNGLVGFFSVVPGQEYTLSMQVSGSVASVVRLALRLGGTVDAVEPVLTGPDGTFDVLTVTGVAGPDETTARFAISSKDAAALVFYVDDLSALPGAAASSGGQIVLDVLAAIQLRGTLDFVVTDFTGATDSAGKPWPETLALEVNPEWTLYDLIEYLVGLGYDFEYAPVNWRAGGDTGWQLRLFGPLGAGVPWQLEADGPVILPGPAVADARPSAAPPVSTVVYGEGAGGVWTVAQSSAAVLTSLERREDFVSNTAVGDTVTLFKVLTHRLDVAATRGAAYTADLTNDGDPLPWFDFVGHDRLRGHLPTQEGQADHVPDATYRVAAMTAKLTAGGRYQQYAVDFGNYRLHAERLRDQLQRRLLQRATTENYQPGTGRVGATGAGGSGTAVAGTAPSDTGGLVAAHEHAWPDILPSNMGGDLAGVMPNPTVARLRGIPISTTPPTTGQQLGYDGTRAVWATGGGATVYAGWIRADTDQAVGAAAFTEVDFGTTITNTGSIVSLADNGFKAVVAGTYLVGAVLSYEDSITEVRARILVDGTQVGTWLARDTAAQNFDMLATGMVPIVLAVDEVVTLEVYFAAAGNLRGTESDTDVTFSIYGVA